jgi:hypothetical protein
LGPLSLTPQSPCIHSLGSSENKSDGSDHARTGHHFHGVGCDQGCMIVRFLDLASPAPDPSVSMHTVFGFL